MRRTPLHEMPAAGVERRTFLQQSLALVGTGTLASCFQSLLSKANAGQVISTPGYGPLRPVKDEATGLELLQLPEGFRYVSYNWTGDPVEGGFTAPSTHDGMGVIASDATSVTLCRNHELETWDKPFGAPAIRYDARAGGGCMNLQFDTVEGKWLRAWPTLSGTVRNCAGGPTPWGTWLSCEETVLGPGDLSDGKELQLEKTHGWIFEINAQVGAPVPLKAMGRFSHEAVAIDPATGFVYETEDRKTAGFYRFLPTDAGSLAHGGKLQMLKAAGAPDLRGGCQIGQTYDVTWVDIDDPELAHTPGTRDTLGVFSQGRAMGGTTFARLEGCWYGNGHIYFNATSGGAAGLGQVWQYDPRRESLKLIFESPSALVLDSPDNIVVSSRGGLLLCEDGKSVPQHLRGLTADGRIFTFAANNVVLNGERNGFVGDFRNEEWCGATFSPDGRWLFVNIQTPGITFAITGPWGEGLA